MRHCRACIFVAIWLIREIGHILRMSRRLMRPFAASIDLMAAGTGNGCGRIVMRASSLLTLLLISP